MFILHLQVTPTDGLPAVICGECRDQLEGFYRFRENAHFVEQMLKGFLAELDYPTTTEADDNNKSSSEVSDAGMPRSEGEREGDRMCAGIRRL